MRKFIYWLPFIALMMTSTVIYSAASHYGPTLANEDLYRVARKIRSSSKFTVQQVMLAILAQNHEAFNQNNINGLKSGYKLRIPTNEQVAKIKPALAAKEVQHQNSLWGKEPKEHSVPDSINPHKSRSSKHANSSTHAPTASKNSNKLSAKSSSLAVSSLTDMATDTSETSPTIDAPQKQNLEITKKVEDFMTETKKFEEETSTQLANLENQNKNLEIKINQLNEQLRNVSYHFIQFVSKQNQQRNYLLMIIENAKKHAFELGGGILALILLSYLLARTFRQKPSPSRQKEHTDDYDFMSSDESIPAKLDLARAYMDMDDTDSAQAILKEIISKGNSQQKREADDLLGKINLK